MPIGNALALDCTLDNSPDDFIAHDVSNNVNTSVSYCELCGFGYVTFIVANPFQSAVMTNIIVVEDLGSPGLVYDPTAPSPITYRVNGGATVAGVAPAGGGSVLTFNLPDVDPINGNNAGTLEVRFAVRRIADPEGLVSADRTIVADLTFDTITSGGSATDSSCDPFGTDSDTDVLPLREPIPAITKTGWNYDAAQRQGTATDPVFGNNNDDVVWEIRIDNDGLAGMQDLRFDDLMQSGSLVISQACPTVGAANGVAANNGAGLGTDCVGASNTIDDFVVTDPFGDMGLSFDGFEVDVVANGTTSIFLVGKITANGSCIASRTNTVDDVQWGCEIQPPAGGITTTSTGFTPPPEVATLTTLYGSVNAELTVNRQLTGTNLAQPVGSNGTMTITITNNTGGSVNNIHLADVLPLEYVVDPTFTPTIAVTSPFGAYPGRVDTLVRNPAAPGDPLTDIAPQFDLLSSSVHPIYADQIHMLRHGDEAVITFRVVLINSSFYDLSADIDIAPEEFPVSATDPDTTPLALLSNTLTVTFNTFCAADPLQTLILTGNGTGNPGPANPSIPAFPEDLDVSMSAPLYIVTADTTNPVPLTVLLTNNGGHDAADYFAYLTFGEAMTIMGVDTACTLANNPPPRPVWRLPDFIPPGAAVYECTGPPIAPNTTASFTFTATQTIPAPVSDDLTFRADVIGEITLSNGTPLTFPAPLSIPSTTPNQQVANNYTLDAFRSRVLGFNLTKSQRVACTEDPPAVPAPVPLVPPAFDDQVRIGEDCSYHIQSGGWFGFETPGFALIEVNTIVVTDDLPDGQGYISHDFTGTTFGTPILDTDPNQITPIVINGGAGSTPLSETDITWGFNAAAVRGIRVRDELFQVDITTRLLNDPVDVPAISPNGHSQISTNIARTSFNAVFDTITIPVDDVFNVPPGYPVEPVRRIDLTVTEPNLLVVKEVCNETLNGNGVACSNFSTLVNDGDTNDSYIYRITLTNEASNSGVTRAPAFNVISTDTLDASDLMLIEDFDTDGLDNDGDGLIDALDPDGEGSISDNTISNATPAVITVSNTHSVPLQRIDPGASVVFYYRVDPDDAIAPLQTLTNTVTTSYDSLQGDFGNQNAPQLNNATIAPDDVGRARIYASIPAQANVQMIPVLTQPKSIIELSNRLPGGTPQEVVIGEEIRYQLTTSLPVANLRNFMIRDELPAGMRCIEAEAVDLGPGGPHAAAGFVPGGSVIPTCTSTGTNDFVEWNFGDREITSAPGPRFAFAINFIARVDNSVANNDTDVIGNGNPATLATASYLDVADTLVTLNFDQVDILVTEPSIALTKILEINTTDAGDVLTVTVTATNNGTAAAYNLRVLDDLVAVANLTFLNNVSGTDPPDSVDTLTFGPNQPIFIWNSNNPLAPGATRTFTFDIGVSTTIQPHKILANTIEADWTSLPSITTALNGTGTIDPNGSIGGMRNGTLPNSGDAINDYETTASDSATVPAVTMTKTDLNPALLPEIGAHKNFQIEIVLPEGITDSLIVSDDLAFGGVSYELSHNADFDITYEFIDIASINGVAPTEASFITFPAVDASGTVVWNIGTVVTATEDDTSGVPAFNPIIRINYHARLNNDLGTNVGSTLQNEVDVNYTNGETLATEILTDTTALVTATEPLLTVTKVGTLITPAPVSGGSLIEYVISMTNVGNATAYDVNIVDSLPSELAFFSAFTPTATIGGTPVAGFVSLAGGLPSGPLNWGKDNGDGSLDIPAGSTLLLTYQTQVQISTVATFDNTVWVDWTSLEGLITYERTGAGCPVITLPDDYCATATSAPFIIIDNNSLSKAVIADTWITNGSTAIDATVRIGDTATYQLTLNLGEGVTNSVTVTDLLPAGMVFDSFIVSPASGAGSFTYTLTTQPAVGATGALDWDFGTVINTPSNDGTPNDALIIEYIARVIENDVNTIAQIPSTPLTNTATLNYLDSAGIPVVDPTRLVDSATLTVLQPVMDAVTKTGNTLTNTVATPLNVNVALDTVQFQLQTCNTTGLAPAYSVLLSDVLATQMDESSIVGPTVIINGAAATAGIDYIYTPPPIRGGTQQFELLTPVNPGQCVTVDYDIGFYTDFGPNQVWNNSVTFDEYWSLPAQSGQQYLPLTSAQFFMTNLFGVAPLSKSVVSPASEVTIGEQVIYQITVPAIAVNAVLNNVVVTDTLHSALEYLSASAVDSGGLPVALTDNTLGQNVNLAIVQIPAGEQVIITLSTQVANNAAANAGVNFTNTAAYTYTGIPAAAVTDGTSAPLLIVEPLIAIAKTVSPLAPPVAGDILQYSVTFTASGGAPGDNFSDAFDLRIDDSLSLGLLYQIGTATVGAGNTIIDPTTNGGDGITTAQTLTWRLEDATADIDVVEGTIVTVTYDVLVLDSVLAGQNLGNSASAQWTGLDGINGLERTGTGTPVENDYFTGPVTTTLTVPDNTTLTKTRLSDTFDATDANVRIGDIIDIELRIGLDEGSHSSLVLSDSLPQGLQFEQVLSINGDAIAPYSAVAPFTHTDIAAPITTGDASLGATTVTWTLGDLVNVSDGNATNDDFVIVYRARVLNLVFAQVNNITLTNSATLDYLIATGPASQTGSENLNLLQPNLALSKSAAPAGGDAIIDAGELITYTVDVFNSGTAPAYDTVLQDIIPLGLRNGAATITMVSTGLVIGGALPNLAPSYDPVTGIAIWDFDTGIADQYSIPAGDTLRIVYTVQADVDLGPGVTLSNAAQAILYYSFDDDAVPTLGTVGGVREIYGPSNIASSTLTTPLPVALLKQTTQAAAAIGELFTYTITVPATPQTTALNDVRILDDLNASAADLTFVSVAKISGSQPWTPVNTGDLKNLVIEDTTIGIDIPAGEQAVIEITVVLDDTATNISGLVFNNTADYTFNPTQDPGLPDTSGDMTIIGADSVTLEKSGPATMRVGQPDTFILNVQNTATAPAWDLTITDLLPNPVPGGMCDTAPTNIVAQIFLANGSTPVSPVLVQGVDYITSFSGAPSCTFTITMQSAAAAIAPTDRLIVSYDVSLDVDNIAVTTLTNVAAATEWFSGDTAGAGATGPIRTFTGILSDGTVGTLDEQDAHTLITESAVLIFQKSVVNVTTGQDPGANAQPGDTLRYTIHVENISLVSLPSLLVIDELDALNASAMFVAGSLSIISIPAGADSSNTDPTGGANGTGLLDIRNLSLDPQGSANDSFDIIFEVTLVSAINSGTVVLNQASLSAFGVAIGDSDDPNVNGLDDPNIVGDEDPTETLIASAPAFQIEKISTDLTGDPAVLEAGDTLRYTITVKNIGDEDSVNTLLSDQIPANTTYVANSTTLNGLAVTDPAIGISALEGGFLINAPENTTVGFMRADSDPAANNVATITFDVVISLSVIDGTVISNQGFVSGDGAGSGVFPQQPSDDPATALPDDPTLDVVGNVPVVDVLKTVAIQIDNGTVGIVDPGDTLRYTITTTNFGAIPATGVVLTDAAPANTTYVANSVFLNTLPVGQPDGGLSPLIAGIDISSSDLTPPLPTAGNGTLSPGESAVVIFDVQVDGAALPGTIISNQGFVSNNELPIEPTDSDGNDANGDQPTDVVVGNVQQLAITKQVFVVGGGVAQAGGQLEYVVRVTNIGGIAATNVVITDNLDLPVAGQMTYVAGSGLLNGLPAGVSFAAPIITADYSATYGDLAPGDVAELRFRVLLDAALALGTTITNIGEVIWNSPPSTLSVSVDIDIGGTPGSANLNGQVWHDNDFDNAVGASEALLQGWTVELYSNNVLLASRLTDVNGVFQFSGLVPNLPAGTAYELRYIAPGAAVNSATLGTTSSVFTNAPQRITDIFAASGSSIQNLNLPIQPNGVVYDAVLRVPVAGVQLSMINQTRSNQPVPATCFDDANHQNQVTLAAGFYKFDLNFSDPTRCAEGDEYEIQVQPPAIGYVGTTSIIIPPVNPVTGVAQDVPICPGTAADQIPATAQHCENSISALQPDPSVAPRTPGTNYYLKFLFNNLPSTDQIFNNHIPVDPELAAAIAISKVAGLLNVTRSQLVPYTITFNNTLAVPLLNLNLVDNFPAGFKYVSGSSRVDGVEIEPSVNGRQLTWSNQNVGITETRIIKLLLIVGSGVGEGEYTNTVQAIDSFTGNAVSGVASATVRVIPDPSFDCTDIIGKVFDDKNQNAYQDEGEPGLAGVQVATVRGLRVTTDAHGRFHVTCAIVPNEIRGSNFIMKLDDRTLPSGYRLTTENPRVQRATRGKMLKFNFGAAIHRVVRLDLADGVFEKASTELRPQWRSRIDLLVAELQKAPSILRLSYLGENETESQVEDRLDAIDDLISDRWQELNCCYKLTIEKEVFWRKGNPSDRLRFE